MENPETTRKIWKLVGKPSTRIRAAADEDALVTAPPKGNLVAVSLTFIEGVHFDLTYTTPRELGHKTLAVALSDIAAMGAAPLYAMFVPGVKQETSEHFLLEFYEGALELAKKHKMDVVPALSVPSPTAHLITVTVIAEAGKAVERRGARPGDVIALTGTVGISAAGLNCLRRLGRSALSEYGEIVKAHLRPEPLIKEAKSLARAGIPTALIDLSDGLAKEIHSLTRVAKVGALIEERLLPISPVTLRAASLLSANPKAWALYGGEDYELLITLRRSDIDRARRILRRFGRDCVVIGEIRKKTDGVKIHTEDGAISRLEPKVWNHFVRRRRASF